MNAAQATGFIVNTCGWVEGIGYQALVKAIESLKINVVIVLGDERLYSEISRQFQGPDVTFIKLPKSGGVMFLFPFLFLKKKKIFFFIKVVVRDTRFRKRARNLKIREYFYGAKDDLVPHRISLAFNEFELYEVGQAHMAPSSALPIGEERKVDETRVVKIEPSLALLNAVLGLSYAGSAEGKTLLEHNVAGFVFVEEVDVPRKRITVLAPSPGKLPKRLLMVGSLMWIE